MFDEETERLVPKSMNGYWNTLDAIREIRIPRNESELKSFLRAKQNVSKNIENLSAHTNELRKLLENKRDETG